MKPPRLLFYRYQAFRRMGASPALSRDLAKESLQQYPSGPAFAQAIVELEIRLQMFFARPQQFQETFPWLTKRVS